MPLQKDNIMVSFDDEGCKLDVQQGILSLSKGTSITIKSQNGEKITGVRLVVVNDNDGTSDSKRKKLELFSCDNGEFDNGIWKGSSDAVTFQAIDDCTIAGIRTSFSTDLKEAYAYGTYEWEDIFDGEYFNELPVPELVFCFDEKRNLHDNEYEEYSYNDYCGILKTYSINDNNEYPEWYGDSINIITFDASFAYYHPKRTSHWFDGIYGIINNLKYLNTAYVEDMSYMFANYHYYEIDRNTFFPKDRWYNDDGGYDEEGYENYLKNNCLAPESFFSSIFEVLEFSNVKNMNHMFSNCNIYSLIISSPNIPVTANIRGIFENSIINYITIDTNSINLRNDFFEGIGFGTNVQPCVIDAPEDFNFGVDTSTDKFLWKGGYFKGIQLQAYVAVEEKHNYGNGSDYFGFVYSYDSYYNDYTITFYYDKKRNVREKLKYSRGGYNTDIEHGYSYDSVSYGVSTYSMDEWENNKPGRLFGSSEYYLEGDGDYNHSYSYKVTGSVSIDESFAQYRPKSTCKWFELASNKGEANDVPYILISGVGAAVTEIKGLEYLNTSETTNTERMFYGLCRLKSLDLSNHVFSKVINSKDMFSECYSLTDLKLNSTLNLDQNTYTDENGNSAYYVLKDDSITFFYDDKMNERNGQHVGDYGNYVPIDYNYQDDYPNFYLSMTSYNGKHAIFDPSFDQRPAGKTVGWFNNSSTLETVQGLQYLHSTDMRQMFNGCCNLTSIDLEKCDMSMNPKTNHMFSNCTSLSEITIPKSCKSIGYYTFYGCSGLTSINISDSVKTIGQSAFSGCVNLKKVNISDLAAWCNIKFHYNYEDEYYDEYYDMLSNPLVYAHNLYLNDNLITDLLIPTSVTSIESSAFHSCTSLASVTIPNSVETIGIDAFNGCSNLTSATIGNNVTSIGENAFSYCSGLTSIDIPDNVTSIGHSAFVGCTSLTSIKVSNSVTNIERNTFSGCSGLAFVTIGNSVTSVKENAFSGCTSLTSVTLPNSVTNIGNYAFYECTNLASVTIPYNVNIIGDCAFDSCPNLTSVTVLNPTPIDISQYTFSNRKNATLYVPYGSKAPYLAANYWKEFKQILTTTDSYAVVSTDGKTLTFYYDNYRKNQVGTTYSLNIGANAPGWLEHSSTITKVVFDESFADATPSSCYRWFYQMGNLTDITGMEYLNTLNTTNMGSMFNGCKNLTSIDVSKFNTANVSNMATMFASCSKLASIDLSSFNTAKVTNMKYMFSSCAALTSIELNGFDTSKVTNMENMFKGCSSLTSLDISMLNLNASANTSNMMLNCTALHTLSIPETANSLDDSACSGIGTQSSPCALVYPDGFIPNKTATGEGWYQWKKGFFCDSNKLITFTDPKAKSLCVGNWDTNGDGELSETEAAVVTSLGTTFKKSQIASFNELQYFIGLTNISDGAFSKSTVGAITLPENITSIGKEAFLDCKSLTSINIPSKVQTLGQNALSGCTAMTSITADGSNTAFCDIDGVLFSKDKTTLIQFPAAKATAYDVPEGTKTIGRDAFYVSKLKTVTLPTSLEELGFDAFGYSNSLEALEIPEGVTTVGDYILDGCKNVKTLHIPSSVTSIGEYMCNGCNALTDVYCAMTTPLAIAKNNFTTTAYNNATLHVPAFAVDAYRDTEGWKYFQNIVGDMASNTLLADALTINVGKTENLLVNLSNSTEIDGVQFDITLPAGLDLYIDEEGDYEISKTTRSKKLTANCTKLSNGKYRFILFSTDRAIISAGEGAIMKIKLACAADAEAGIKEIAFSGISLSCVSGNVSVNQFCDDFTSMVTIKKVSDIQGDANGDFAVNITDVMEIVNYILDMTSRTFVFDNADVDRNGVVNITDVMNVVNILLGNAIGTNAPANARTMPYDLLRISSEDYGCTLHTTFQTQKVTAMQMSVILPDDCLLESATLMGEASRTHKVLTRRIDDNRYNIVVFSTNGTTLSTDAPVLDLGIRGRGGMVNVENIQCTDTDLETLLSADISTVITGIGGIIADGDNGNAPVYNTQGQRMNKPQRGINISEGRKVVVK